MSEDKVVVGRVSFGPSRGGGQTTSKQHGYAGDPPGDLEYAIKGTTAELAALKVLVRELVKSLRTVAWRSKIHLIDCGCVDCDRAQELITRADVKAVMGAPA